MNSSLNPLVLLTFFPLLGFLVIVLLKKQQKTAIRWTAPNHFPVGLYDLFVGGF